MLTKILYYAPETNRARFKSFDMDRSLRRKLYFHFERQVKCNAANDPQRCPGSPWRSWSDPQESRVPMT